MVSTQSTALPAGKAHDKFTAWAVQNANIRINKVKVAAFRNAGIGIVAMEDIKVATEAITLS